MSSLRRDNRLDRVHQCVRIAEHRYLATCENGVALIDVTEVAAISGWIEHQRPMGIAKFADNIAVFVDAAGATWQLTVVGNALSKSAGPTGATRMWIAVAGGLAFYSGRSPGEWRSATDGSEGSFGGHAADFVAALEDRLYAFDKNGWLSIYDLAEARVVEVTELVGCTGGIHILELPQDGRFSYVSIRDRMVYVYEDAPGGYVLTAQTPVDYVDGLPGDTPWWNQPGVVTVQPPLTFGNGFVRTDERAPDIEPDFVPIEAIPDQVATPVLDPTSGEYADGTEIEMTCATPGARIRFTDDGTEPDGSSTLYTAPYVIAGSVTLKAKGFKGGAPDSNTAEETYVSTSVPAYALWDTTSLKWYSVLDALVGSLAGVNPSGGVGAKIHPVSGKLIMGQGDGSVAAYSDGLRSVYTCQSGVQPYSVASAGVVGSRMVLQWVGNPQLGNDKLGRSDDGVNWTAYNGPFVGGTGYGNGLANTTSRFVHGGQTATNTPRIGYSTDGVSWTIVVPPSFPSAGTIYATDATGNAAVVIGVTDAGNTTLRLHWSSDGGVTWSNSTNLHGGSIASSGISQDWVIACPTGFYLWGAGRSYFSPTGQTWTDVGASTVGLARMLGRHGDGVLARFAGNDIRYSANGSPFVSLGFTDAGNFCADYPST